MLSIMKGFFLILIQIKFSKLSHEKLYDENLPVLGLLEGLL